MTITTEELETLVRDACMDDFPTCRQEAKAKLDAASIRIARELLAARKVVEAAQRVSDEYGSTMYGQSIHSMRDLDPALTAYDQASKSEGGKQ